MSARNSTGRNAVRGRTGAKVRLITLAAGFVLGVGAVEAQSQGYSANIS